MLVQLQGLLNTIGILDIIDTLLVAFCLYHLYLMLKNTRAAALAKGLFVLVFFMFLSKWLNLHVINWILEKSMTVLMVALPVVFQPELRRALEQIGRGRLFRKSTELDEQELEEVVSDVTGAVVVMSQRKLGALIVFEREIGLEERIETGVLIDGLVSEGLLLNIFEKDTPLHDGAVIIRGKRIVAASCLLPLTDARNLSQELGTRHRSAIGISEQSDALIIIVSEETGVISLAKNGELQRFLHADDVKELLRNAIMLHNNSIAEDWKEKFLNFRGNKK